MDARPGHRAGQSPSLPAALLPRGDLVWGLGDLKDTSHTSSSGVFKLDLGERKSVFSVLRE